MESLPDVPQHFMTEMYSGQMPVYGSLDRALFFVFQPTVGEPVDEVTIWLNGGPGYVTEGFKESLLLGDASLLCLRHTDLPLFAF